MRSIFILLVSFVMMGTLNAQSLDELKAQRADLEARAKSIIAQADEMKAEIDGLNNKIAEFPGWYRGASGILGANVLGRNDWFSAGDLSNSKATNISATFTGFLNKLDDKYFWRNTAGINLGWQKLRLGNEPEGVDPKFEAVADVLNISSLYGYNLTSKIAASALGEYRTSLIKNANNPGYLDIGVGFTYTPMNNLIVVLHPINQNFIFSKEGSQFTPSLGCKLVADYNTELVNGLNWRTNLTGFLSYKSNDPSLHNGTWTNWFGFNVWKSIGVGVEFGLRLSKQEIDELQNYYTVGLSYKI